MAAVSTVLAVCFFGGVNSQTPVQVKSLVDNLLSKYDKRIRPVENQALSVTLDVSFSLISIIGVDEVNEKLETSGHLTILWIDSLLKWDPASNNGISTIFLPQNDIWKPDIVLGNGIRKFEEFGGSFYNVEVDNFGDVLWKPFQVFETQCSIYTTYFPYDREVCEIVFVVWSYTIAEVEISRSTDGINLNEYKESGVWEITRTDVKISKESLESKVTFSIHIKRKPFYYVFNIMIPILFLGMLTILVFALPGDAGEKMSYAMTVFLSFAVFLTIINTLLPVSSETTPVLSIYLLMQMTMGFLVLFITALQIRLHHRDTSVPISKPFRFMVRLMHYFHCRKSCKISPAKNKDSEERDNFDSVEETSQEEENRPEWKDVTSAIDFLAFWSFFLLYLCLTVYLFATIIRGS
ncbi:neuronal acetylcholine receptor subunit alpha-6-like [Crassostrea angulata]|uniref:neuronal acetylcholine receptor subunit alpha-6-like n=1 Tax=Magallana angulata TaxID=2784310 RepID=UPI0022B12B17|nr:neuronal acetylcholine receptor subunit alpha-6-like [Crassostrea angulata]